MASARNPDAALALWAVVNARAVGEAESWAQQHLGCTLPRAAVTVQQLHGMARVLGRFESGARKVQIIYQRHGDLVEVPPYFPHAVSARCCPTEWCIAVLLHLLQRPFACRWTQQTCGAFLFPWGLGPG